MEGGGEDLHSQSQLQIHIPNLLPKDKTGLPHVLSLGGPTCFCVEPEVARMCILYENLPLECDLMIEEPLPVFCPLFSMRSAPLSGGLSSVDLVIHTAAYLCLPLDAGPLEGEGNILGTILFSIILSVLHLVGIMMFV